MPITPLVVDHIVNTFVTKGHPFFTPERLGKNKKVFRMFKFRSMKYNAPVISPYEMTDEQKMNMKLVLANF